MIKINRIQLIKWHALLACFFLPVAAMFFVSGALYTLDIKGSANKKIIMASMNKPFTPDLDVLTKIATQTLQQSNLPLPHGEPFIKKKKNRYQFIWNDLAHSVMLTPTKNDKTVKITFQKRNFLAQIMRFHKGGAGDVFETVSVAMTLSLLFILISGVFMAQSMPILRKPSWIALALGTSGILILMTVS